MVQSSLPARSVSLSDKDLEEIERQAVELAWEAGNILLGHFHGGPLHVEYKGKTHGDDPVTEADHHAETFLKEELARRFPDHGIVGEEGAGEGSDAASLTWVVDPLDGTTNFLNGLPMFASSIGLIEDGVPIVAAVFIPWPVGNMGRVLHARMGGGSWDGDRRLRVAEGISPVAGRVVVLPTFRTGPFRAQRSLAEKPGERRSVGSTAFELALVADGKYQYAVFARPRSWDVAAGILLVQEAEGWVMTRSRAQRGWHPFNSFASPKDDGPPGQKLLRDWANVIVVGNPEMTNWVSRRVRIRRPWRRRLLGWLPALTRRVGSVFRRLAGPPFPS
jgi:myo-inositol-1(or 4)-monophosphatase